ncbi:MAG: ATP-binding protein [Aeromonas veronii]
MSDSHGLPNSIPTPLAQALAKSRSEGLPTREEHCEIHGAFISTQYLGRIWLKCPKCTKAADLERQALEKAKTRERAALLKERNLAKAGIPPRYQDRTLDNYRVSNPGQQRALDFCRHYAEHFDEALRAGRCAVFVGGVGTGKTHLCLGIAHALLDTGEYRVYYTTTLRAIRRIKDTWGRSSSETESQAVAALVSPDLLIMDEVGVQFGSETEKTLLFDVLNERYERRKPTLLLSNLPAKSDNPEVKTVKAYLGERVYSRLREDGGEYLTFDWDDYRAKKRN